MGFSKPIFAATHPRACSTAFERVINVFPRSWTSYQCNVLVDMAQVFMTRPDILQCVHEPFGDAFYYGPERLSARFEKDEAARARSGFANVTYKDVLDLIVEKAAEVRIIPPFPSSQPAFSNLCLPSVISCRTPGLLLERER